MKSPDQIRSQSNLSPSKKQVRKDGSRIVMVELTTAELTRLDHACQQLGLTRAELIEIACREKSARAAATTTAPAAAPTSSNVSTVTVPVNTLRELALAAHGLNSVISQRAALGELMLDELLERRRKERNDQDRDGGLLDLQFTLEQEALATSAELSTAIGNLATVPAAATEQKAEVAA